LFLFCFILLFTKRPPMLWGSTCRAVTSFRPYELVDRPGNAYICQSNAYAYRPPYRYTTECVYLPTDQSSDDRPYVSIGRLHRTATTLLPLCHRLSIVPLCLRSTRPPVVPIRLLLRPDHYCAYTPTVPLTVRSCRYACDPRLSLAPYCYIH
jgi:hypothetical protein